jgi:hypothetical protein
MNPHTSELEEAKVLVWSISVIASDDEKTIIPQPVRVFIS